MPISKYFQGHGDEVASNMQKEYGDKWKQVFYATANKKKMKPKKVKRVKDLMNPND